MELNQTLLDAKIALESRYDEVSLLGSGRAKFVRVSKHGRSSVISVDEEGWLVELWSENDLGSEEETLVEEEIVQERDDAIQRVHRWLDR